MNNNNVNNTYNSAETVGDHNTSFYSPRSTLSNYLNEIKSNFKNRTHITLVHILFGFLTH